MQIGFIGLGNLGTPIAENLSEQHAGMLVYNRTIEKAKPLENKGAKLCHSVKELASLCDVVFTIVSNDAAIKEITEGEDGIAANLKSNGIHVSMSTITPAVSNELYKLHQQHGNHYVTCPVAGRPDAAKNKKLNFMVSGDEDAVSVIKPLLKDAGAVGVWDFGNDAANANVAKLCTNYLILVLIQSLAEGINLAKKSGIDEKEWIHMITSTLFNAPAYINYGNVLLTAAYKPALFSLELGLKDAALIMNQSETVDAKMFIGAVVKQQLQELLDKGYGDYDTSALALSVK